MRSRAVRFDKLARIYDDEILPVWAERFGRMLLRDLVLPGRCQVLDVACGTGYPAVEVVRRMGADSRLIALDASSAMLDVARRKMHEMGAKGVFFRTENADARLSFADDVYDLVLCNLGLGEMSSPAAALADFARVTKPGGEVRCTLPIEGSFQEFFDIYREVLTKHDKHEVLARLDEYVATVYPPASVCEGWLAGAGLGRGAVELERFTMLFRSSREFFFAPVIEYGPLAEWKALAGKGQEMQDVFWYIKEAIDAYFADRAFEVTVVACCLRGRKAGGAATARAPSGGDLDFGELDDAPAPVAAIAAIEPAAPAAPAGATDADADYDVDGAELESSDEPTGVGSGSLRILADDALSEDTLDRLQTHPHGAPPAARPGQPAASDGDDDGDDDGGDADEPLDAFVEGKPRPRHLDED